MKWRVTCYACGGEGVGDGCTCMDDTCCCLWPEPPECDICNGEGSFIVAELTEDNCDDAIPVEVDIQPAKQFEPSPVSIPLVCGNEGTQTGQCDGHENPLRDVKNDSEDEPEPNFPFSGSF